VSSFQRVSIPARPEVWTFQDAIERLISMGELQRNGRNYDLMLDAVMDAYRDFPKYHEWTYYQRISGISTEASYSTGTVAYSASTKQFTLTGGTWPTNAALGTVRIGTNFWDAWTRTSATVLTMDADFAPPSDIDAGTAFEWFRDSYQFPSLTRKMGRLIGGDGWCNVLRYVDPQEGLAISKSRYTPAVTNPLYWTIRADKRYLNSLSIVLIPPPASERSYRFHEEPAGQALTVEKLSEGTATVNGSPTATRTVTFSSAVLDSALHLGCVLRLSSNGTTEPTGLRGASNTAGARVFNPYAAQRIITSVVSPTECTVDSDISVDYSDVRYTISSPLDIKYNSMLSAFWSLIAWEFKKNCFADGKMIGQAEHRFMDDLRFAQADDKQTLFNEPISNNQYYPYYNPVGNFAY
jgi:hypothetical protein